MLGITKAERYALKQTLSLLELNKRRFAWACFLGSLGLGSSVALGAVAAWLIARASQMPPVLYLEIAVVSVRLFGISKAFFRYLERLASHYLAVQGMSNLRTNVYIQLSKADPSVVASIKRGEILNRMGKDVDAIGDFIVKSLLPAVIALIVGVGTVCGIALISPSAAAFLALGLFISGVVAPSLTIRSAKIAEKADSQARTQLAELAMQMMDGATQIRTNNQSSQVFANLAEYERELNKAKDKAAYPAAWASAVDYLAMMGAVVIAAYFGIWGVSDETIAEVNLAVLALTPLAAFEATAALGPAAMQLVKSASAAQRVLQLLPLETASLEPGNNSESSRDTRSNPVASADTTAVPVELKLSRDSVILEAVDLSVAWGNGPVVAENINFTLAPGKKIAFVGPSGIGKTTLLYTLCGMIPPRSGRVLVNGKDISKLSRAEAARLVALTTEDAHIFATSVLENVRVGKGNLSPEEAVDKIKQAGLSEWLATLPSGLDTLLGSGGNTISGGERRRLLLARAYACGAPLLLLDEIGEHLDTETADYLIRELFTTQEQQGILLVTHRYTPLEKADEICFLGKANPDQAARILARGSHQYLAANCPEYAWNLKQEQLDEQG